MINYLKEREINKVINGFIDPLLSSLQKGEREILYNNSYVAGGAIVSIIQGNMPNDVDIFFDNEKFQKQFIDNIIEKEINKLNFISQGFATFRYKQLLVFRPREEVEADATDSEAEYSSIGEVTLRPCIEVYWNKQFKEDLWAITSLMLNNASSTINNFFTLDSDYRKKAAMINKHVDIINSNCMDYNSHDDDKNISIINLSSIVNSLYAIRELIDDDIVSINIIEKPSDIVMLSCYAITFRNNVQVVTTTPMLPEDKIKVFDFMHCMTYKYLNSSCVYIEDNIEYLIKEKILVFNLEGRKERAKRGELTYRERIDRFLRRGYTLEDEEVKRVENFIKDFGFNSLNDCLYMPKTICCN